MTRINRMVMRGFKSFANKTELIFGKNFNCVLGPNGSGKSNVIDAICFVLGKGSAKGLRVEKATNLIYNGGKTKQPAKEGEVSIVFDNTDKIFPTEDKELTITRIVKQNGQSVYKINNKNRTRQQILDLLSVARIKPDGYNIMLQGDIVDFVEMSTQRRRAVIEEVSGIYIYEEKKIKAIAELNKVENRLNEADIILTERKTHLNELKSERDHAMKYKDTYDKLNQSKATVLSTQITFKENKKNEVAQQIQTNKEKIQAVREKINETIGKIKEYKNNISAISNEIEQKGEKEQVRLHKEVELLKVDFATNKTRIGSCDNEIARITNRKDQLNKSLLELNEKVDKLRKEKEDFKIKIKKLGEEKNNLDKKIVAFKDKHKLDNTQNIETDIDILDKEAEDKQAQIQVLREEQQNLLREKDRFEIQIQNIDDKIKKVLEVEKEHKAEIQNLKAKKDEFKKSTNQLNQLLNDDSSVAAELGGARAKLLSAEENLAKLKAQGTHLREKIARNLAIEKIIENKNKFDGVYDTVSNLGKVQKKFSLALEIAAGPRIKSIVVDTDATAAKCINFLKQNRYGTATFLPLNKIKVANENDQSSKFSKANGVHGFAVDLVSTESKFKKIFQYVFGSTLVVENMDVARRIGIGEARMVTLDGDLLESSGAMIGGFREKERKFGFQEKEVLKDIEDAEGKIIHYQKFVRVFENKRKENEEEIARLREFKANLEGEIIKTEKSLHLDSTDLDSSKKVKEDFREENKVVEKKLVEVENKISQLNSQFAALKIKKLTLKTEIAQLRDPVVLAELNTFQQKRDEFKDQINLAETELKNLDVQIDTIMLPEKANIQKILKQHDKEEEDFKAEIVILKDKIKEQEKSLKEKEKKEKEFYAQFKELFNKRTDLSNLMQKEENSIKDNEYKIREIEMKINNYSLDNARLTAELAALSQEKEQYRDFEMISGKTEEELSKDISRFQNIINSLGAVNMRALEIYEAVEREYNQLMEKMKKLSEEKQDVMSMMTEIESKKKDIFMKTFDSVNETFKHFFLALSRKGDAFLEIENKENPFDAGVEINVKITGTKFLDIRSLSGGEKTLTALAFIFAIQEHDPASFYVMDEVDAALDKHNSEKLSQLIKKYSEKSQYVIISHNDGIISEADTLYGVSMNEHGMSKVVSLKI